MVRVKDNLQVGSFYSGVVFEKDMEEYRGKIGKIDSYNSDGYIAIDGFYNYFGGILIWSVDMIEPLKKEFTVYSSPTKFFMEKDGIYIEVKEDSVEINKYPKEEEICYEVEFNGVEYSVHTFRWYNSDTARRLFDTGHIFTDIEKAQDIADKFNKIILDNK